MLWGWLGGDEHPSDQACMSQFGRHPFWTSIRKNSFLEVERSRKEGAVGQHILASPLCRGCGWPFAAPQKGRPTTNTLTGQVTSVCAWKVLVFYLTSKATGKEGRVTTGRTTAPEAAWAPLPQLVGFRYVHSRPSPK